MLHSAYPNPFNSSTILPLALTRDSYVKARVFDTQGRTVSVIIEGRLSAGQHSFIWQGLDAGGRPLPAGQYFCEFEIGNTRFTRPLTLLR
jgi:flagellar hook assembly protein FlgD